MKSLSDLHPHPRDSRIRFFEDTHTYVVDGSSSGILSVTALIHKYFPGFNAALVLSRMSSAVKLERYGDLTDAAIQKKWREDGKKAAERGTALHRSIERFYNGQEVDDSSVEYRYFLSFHESIRDRLTPYRTEWSIFDGDMDLAGQLDMLYKMPDGRYALYDWKCIKELRQDNRFEKGLGSCAALENCNYNHYSLQLHLYKKILETRYDLVIGEMALVVLHSDHPSYLVYEVRDVSGVVDQMTQERVATIF